VVFRSTNDCSKYLRSNGVERSSVNIIGQLTTWSSLWNCGNSVAKVGKNVPQRGPHVVLDFEYVYAIRMSKAAFLSQTYYTEERIVQARLVPQRSCKASGLYCSDERVLKAEE
jgi:hypothetical protein